MDTILPYLQQLLSGLFASGGDVAGTAGKALGGMDMAGLAALAAALGWASGVRLYLVVFIHRYCRLYGAYPTAQWSARAAAPSHAGWQRCHAVC